MIGKGNQIGIDPQMTIHRGQKITTTNDAIGNILTACICRPHDATGLDVSPCK